MFPATQPRQARPAVQVQVLLSMALLPLALPPQLGNRAGRNRARRRTLRFAMHRVQRR